MNAFKEIGARWMLSPTAWFHTNSCQTKLAWYDHNKYDRKFLLAIMRILVISQPASGHAKIRALLSRIYALKDLNHSLDNLPGNDAEFKEFVENELFTDNSILSHHYPPSRSLTDSLKSIDCHVIYCIRDPYDAFESLYFNANSKVGIPLVASARALRGIPLDDEAVFHFIRSIYGNYLKSSRLWLETGNIHAVRYEELVEDTLGTIENLCESISPVPNGQVNSAVSNKEQAIIKKSRYTQKTRLSIRHLQEISQNFAPIVEALGYTVRIAKDEEFMQERIQDFGKFIDEFSEKERFFIIGRGKSGTTWLYMTFFHHPNSAMVAERKLIEQPDKNAALLQPLLDDKFFFDWFSSSSFGVSTPEQKSVRYELGRVMSDYLLFRSLALRSDHSGLIRPTHISHVGEKIALNTKDDAVLTMETLAKLYPAAKILHIVRDPRDVVISALFHRYRNCMQKQETNWLTRYIGSVLKGKSPDKPDSSIASKNFNESAMSWNEIVDIFHHKGQALFGNRYKTIRYEDLLADTRGVTDSVFNFIGVDSSPDIIEKVLEKTSFKALSKGRASGEQDASSFFRKGVSGDWKNYLSEDDERNFRSIAGNMMSHFGYE